MSNNVAVMGTNSLGEAEVAFYAIEVSESDRALGKHLQQAKARFFEAGGVAQIAFDKSDPAWSAFQAAGPGNPVYREITHKIINELQDCLIPDREVDGGDLVDRVSSLLNDILVSDLPAAGEPNDLYVIHGPGGFWRDGGLVEEISVTMDAEVAQELGSSPLYSVAKVGPGALDTIGDFPTETCLLETAEAAMERAMEDGFDITDENAAEVMREELALDGLDDMPQEFSAILAHAMKLAQEKQAQRPRQRG